MKLTNILEGEEGLVIKTTAKELKEGLPLKVNCPDGFIFAVTRR